MPHTQSAGEREQAQLNTQQAAPAMQTKQGTGMRGRDLNLGTMVRDIKKSLYAIICLAISAGLVSYIFFLRAQTPAYTVQATYVVTATGYNNSAIRNLETANEIAYNFSKIVTSSEMQSIIAKDMGDGRVGGTITAKIVEETNLLQLRVTSSDPRRAFLIIRSIMNNQKMILNYLSDRVRLSVLVSPDIPERAGGMEDPARRAGMVFLIALALLLAAAAALSYLRDTIRSSKDIENKLYLPCLGTIGHEEKIRKKGRKGTVQSMLITRPTVSFPYTESIHRISRKVRNRMHKDGSRILMVTSVNENEGKSTVISNLALSISAAGRRVLLMDLDMRKPSLYKIFDVEDAQIDTIGKVLQGTGSAKDLIQVLSREKLSVIFNTKEYSRSTELLSGERLKVLLQYLREQFDYILIDTPPMQTVADAEVVAGAAEASLLVIREHQTPVPAILEALDSLRDSNAKPIGCVLNDSYGDLGASLGGYQYGSDYGYRYGKGYGKYYGRYYGHYGDRTDSKRKNGDSASRRSRRSGGTQEGTSGN